MNTGLLCVLGLLSLGLVTLVAALLFGGPGPAPEMASISNPFKTLDWSGLPSPARYKARDGAELAYRHYAPAAKDVRGSVVLVHGSSASSQSMHILASAFSQAGYGAYTLDIRGHGESGQRGTIAYIGQLEDDLEDFAAAVAPSKPTTLAGFSSGVASCCASPVAHGKLCLTTTCSSPRIWAPLPPTTDPTVVAG